MADFTFQINPRWSDLPSCSALLNGLPADYLVEEYRTTLSVRAVVPGLI